MNKVPKNLLIIIIILFLLVSASNYVNSSLSIDKMAYVMAIGVDVGDTAKYKISFQLSTIESSASEAIGSSSSSEPSESSTPNYVVNTVESNSIDNAINIINTFVNKRISLSNCKILVISEDLAKQSIENVINSLINKVEIRPDCNIIVSKIPKEEFSDGSSPDMEELLTKYYDVESNEETRTVVILRQFS